MSLQCYCTAPLLCAASGCCLCLHYSCLCARCPTRAAAVAEQVPAAALLPAADCVAALLDAIQGTMASSDMTKELLKLKHDAPAGNWVTHEGESVLLLAAYSRSSAVVELLLTRKAVADIDATDACGTTPLHLAAYLDSVPCCALLVDAGASTSAMDGDGEHAFDVTDSSKIQAVLRGDTEITETDEETEDEEKEKETEEEEKETEEEEEASKHIFLC